MHQVHGPSSGLYAITPADWPAQKLLAAVDEALTAGLRRLQYRAKPQPDESVARQLLARCRRAGAQLIINDDVVLAARIGADGVHVGRDDGDLAAIRRQAGDGLIVGASCYNDLERARRLAQAGADELAFGSVHASPTKPDAVHCPLDVLTQARELGRPVIAIGGIVVGNAAAVISAGADWLAVGSALFSAADIGATTRQFQELFASS
ncbi:MAG TPA: thiamine phosphate synthase [Wenzhouxiangella sp.]|nr:thiamine phosphate synthase [Wenzhouxiangella sp.]